MLAMGQAVFGWQSSGLAPVHCNTSKQVLAGITIQLGHTPHRPATNHRLGYCKPLNVSVPFISRISQAKQNSKIEGHEYQLWAKIRLNYYSISNCMVLVRQNERGQNNFAC